METGKSENIAQIKLDTSEKIQGHAFIADLEYLQKRQNSIEDKVSNQNKAITENRERIIRLEECIQGHPEDCHVNRLEYKELKEDVDYLKKFMKVFTLLCVGALIDMAVSKLFGGDK